MLLSLAVAVAVDKWEVEAEQVDIVHQCLVKLQVVEQVLKQPHQYQGQAPTQLP
jgi:hypothetical protein